MSLHAKFDVSTSYSLLELGDTKREIYRQTDMTISTRLLMLIKNMGSATPPSTAFCTNFCTFLNKLQMNSKIFNLILDILSLSIQLLM